MEPVAAGLVALAGDGPAEPPPAVCAGDKVNILLVDDQPAKLMGYAAILSELGDNLMTADSADQAFAILLTGDVAVVLIDACMPELDGFELAATIHADPRFQAAALILVSAMPVTDFDLIRGYAAGAIDFLQVPTAPELLRAKLRVFTDLFRKTRQFEARNAERESRVEMRTREREAAQTQVHEMHKIESLGKLTGAVAHDFNNLLMIVLGNLEILREMVSNEPRQLRLVDNAISGAERGAALTSRMLAFARRQELRPETVHIPELIDSMVEMLRRSLGPSIRIATELDQGAAPTRVDPNQLELAVLNLVSNARDAMPNGGDLTIAARGERLGNGDVAGLPGGAYVCLTVADTGTGMDPETLKRATEPFFTTKSAGRGTGLGLSVVAGLVAPSGGAMRIRSERGVGTVVELRLPICVPEAAEGTGPAPPLDAAGPGGSGEEAAVDVADTGEGEGRAVA